MKTDNEIPELKDAEIDLRDACYVAMAGEFNDSRYCDKIIKPATKENCTKMFDEEDEEEDEEEEDDYVTDEQLYTDHDDEEDKEEEDENPEMDGDCPIPKESNRREISSSKEWGYRYQSTVNYRNVGPKKTWYDEEMTKPKQFICYDEEGDRQGYYVSYDMEGHMTAEGEYLDDEKTGLWTTWYNGNIKEEATYKDGKWNGPYKSYLTDDAHANQVNKEGNYVDGEEDGIWKLYHLNGNIRMQIEYSEGEISGNSYRWYADGKKQTEKVGSYTDGKFTGYEIRYDLGGIRCEYVDGEYASDDACSYI